jgi:hypothetical protein
MASGRYVIGRIGLEERDLWKYAFTGRLERWVRKEGYKKIPSGLSSAFFDSLDSSPNPGLAATTKSALLRS